MFCEVRSKNELITTVCHTILISIVLSAKLYNFLFCDNSVHNFVKIYFKNFAVPVVNIHIKPHSAKYFSKYGPDLDPLQQRTDARSGCQGETN